MMRQTLGALAALAVLGILLVGPLYVAVSSAHDNDESLYRCGADMGCDTTINAPNPTAAPLPPAG